MLERFGVFSYLSSLGGVEVVYHALIEGEEGRGSSNLSTHVTDRSHTRAGERLDTRSVVFNNGTCATFDRQNTRHFQDNV